MSFWDEESIGPVAFLCRKNGPYGPVWLKVVHANRPTGYYA